MIGESNDLEMKQVESLVILPPYVEPEHRQLIEKAEGMLEGYEEILIERIKSKLFDHSPSIQTHPSDIKEAEIEYNNDPTRKLLLKQLMNIKIFCERPRFMVTPIETVEKSNGIMTDENGQDYIIDDNGDKIEL